MSKLNLNQIDMSRVEEQLDSISSNVSEILDIVSSGGGGGGGHQGEIRVRFIYRDKTTGKEKIAVSFHKKGDNATFPTDVGNVTEVFDSFGNLNNPALTFQGWTHSQEQLNNLQRDIDVGATYITADGWTYFILRVTSNTTGNIPTYFNKSDNSTLTVDMGDGSPLKTSTATGDINFQHTYSDVNKIYVVKAKITEGSGTFTFGNGTSSTVAVGGNNANAKNSLISVFVGTGVTDIGDSAFNVCRSLTSVVIPNSVTSIGNNVFYGCYSLTSVVIPNSVTSIGNYAFSICTGLTSVVIPNSVTSIGNYAFYGCYSLTSVVIPNSVTSIGNYAFTACYSLTSVVIPNSVTSIGNNAFNSCTGLILYKFENEIPPTIAAASVFNGINASAVFIVPNGKGEVYRTATNFTIHANRIFEEQERWF